MPIAPVLDKQGIALESSDIARCLIVKQDASTMITFDHDHTIELLSKYNANLNRINHPGGILQITSYITGNVRSFKYMGIFGNGTLWACVEDANLKVVLK